MSTPCFAFLSVQELIKSLSLNGDRLVPKSALRSKKVRKRKKKKECDSRRENYYLENNESANRSQRDITTIEETFPTGDNLAINKKSNRAVSMESLTLRGRERAWSRVSTIHSDEFWARHFDGQNSVSWEIFRAAFLDDYGAVIHDFAPKRIHWILSIVHTDIFAAADNIHKLYYDKFCGRCEHPDCLWLKIKEYASERIFREGVIESMFE